MVVGACRVRLRLHGCSSLKEKRGLLKPLLARLQREFNVAVAETELQDVWQSAELGLVTVSNDAGQVEAQLRTIVGWIERHRPDLDIVDAVFETR
jgi:uncharacterized protein YlxP (DUF503 family)